MPGVVPLLTKALTQHEKARKIVAETKSLCPECLRLLPAQVYEAEGKIWIWKRCPEHGEFNDLYWGSAEMYYRAKKYAHDGKGVENPQVAKQKPVCPYDCGLCNIHMTHTLLANLVLTNRCDLNCWYCFFFAERAGYVYEPSLDQIRHMVKVLRSMKPIPAKAVQLTGGEPALRDDLVEIIKICKEEGLDHVQLNTDGLRLSSDPELAFKVRRAGVNTVYLSYDGTTPETNPKNHWEIPRIMENCRKAGLGIVLVPTIINTVNDGEVGPIVKFGFDNLDIIRGVNFQPVSLVGRMPKHERERFRITIPDLIMRIEDYFNGEIGREDFYPVPCTTPISEFVESLAGKPKFEMTVHFACGMATYVFKDEGGKLIPLPKFVDVQGLFEYLAEKAEELKQGKNRYRVLAGMLFKLGSFIDREKQPKGLNLPKILFNIFLKHDYRALGVFHHKTLFIGMMHFQDLYNWDIERVKRCGIHYAVPDGRVIPFCTFNVIPQWYRDKIHREYGIPIEEWERRTGRKLKDDYYKRPKIGHPEAKAPPES
ncbi:MAG: tetraether lipid synthase Tes [Candidatus Hecatellaceae archaeon]